MPEKEQKYDEFGIPIKSSSVAEQQFDEFGIPVKKKESTQSQSPSVDGISDSANGGSVPSTFKDLLAGQIGKQPLLPNPSIQQPAAQQPVQQQAPVITTKDGAPYISSMGGPDLTQQPPQQLRAVSSPLETTAKDIKNYDPNIAQKESLSPLMAGTARLVSGISKTPSFLWDMYSSASNALNEAIGNVDPTALVPSSSEISKDTGMRNVIGENLDVALENYNKEKARRFDKDLKTYFTSGKEGDFSKGLEYVAMNVGEAIPTTIAIALSGGAAGTLPTFVGGSAVFGAEKKSELDKNNPDLTEGEKVSIAMTSGLMESASESLFGAVRYIGAPIKSVFVKEGKDAALKLAEETIRKSYGKAFARYFGSQAEEAITEVANQYGQNVLDKYSGVDPERDLTSGLFEAAVTALAMSGTVGSPVLAGQLVASSKKSKEKAQQILDQKQALENDMASNEVSPEAKQHISNKIKDLNEQEYEITNEAKTKYESLSPENKTVVDSINQKINSISNALNDPNISDESRMYLEQDIDSAYKQIEDIYSAKPEGKTTTETQPVAEQKPVLTTEEKDELDTLTALNEDGFLGEEEKARMAELQQKQTVEAPVSQNTYFQDKTKEENRDLPAEQKTIEQKFAKDLDENYEQRKAEYVAKNGNVFDTDRARELSPDYTEDPTLSQAVHVPAREFVTKVYKEELAKPAPEGKQNVVTFTSGGSGAGKTMAVNAAKDDSHLVVDANLSRFDDAKKDIQEALDAGKQVDISFVYRDPKSAFIDGVMGGRNRGGRTVPLDVAMNANKDSLETIKQLADFYKDNPDVQIKYYNNSKKGSPMQPLSLEDVKKIENDYEQVKKEVQDEIDRKYQSGEIDERQYKGFSGRTEVPVKKDDTGGVQEVVGREIEKDVVEPGGRVEKTGVSAGNRLFNEPIKGIAEIADKYYEGVFGRPRPKFTGVNTIDVKRAKRIAEAYAKMKHDPNNKDVKAAYEALAKETIDQYNFLIDSGYSIEITDGDTYANSQELIDDVSKTKKIKIFSTEAGFGQNAITDKQRDENPMLKDSGLVDVNGKKLLINDLFRAVHDLFGHGELGNSFGPKGEENAYQVHARMFSPIARKALATETRGQNSFVNFSGINEEVKPLIEEARRLRDEGKEEEAKKVAKQIADKLSFADQKIGLLPDEFINIEEEETTKKQDKNAVTERNITESDQQQYQEGDARGKTAKAGDSDRIVKGGQKQAKQQKEVVSEKPVIKKPATLENEMKALEEEEAAEETTTEEDQATKQKLFDDVKAMKAQGANVAELKFKGILERAYKAKADKKIKRTTYTEIKNMIKDVYGGKAVNKEDAKIRVSGMIQEVKDKLLGQGYKNITLGTILPITPKNIADLLDLTEKLIHKGIDAGYGIAEATQRALNAVKKVPLYKRLVDNKELNPAEFEKMLDTAIAQKLKGTKEAMASPDITKGTDKRKTTKRLKTDKSFDDILTEMGNDGETYAVLNLKKADKHVKGVVKEFERNGLLEDLAVEIAAGRNPFYPGIKEYASFHVADRLRSLAEKEGNAMQKSALTKLAAEVLAQRAKNVTAAGQTISVEKLVAEQLPLSKEGITDHVQSVMSTVQDTHMSEEQKNEVKTAFTDINSLLLDPNVQEAINKAAEEKINEIAEATKGKEWVDKVDKSINDLKIDLEDC